MRLIVFTVAIGRTDAVLAPAVVDPSVEYLCFSDREVCVPPYEWIEVESADDSRLASRRLKVLADHPRLRAASATLYHDASYRLLCSPAWVTDILTRELCDLIALRHPKRRTAEKEGRKVAKYGYLTREEAKAHVARYRGEGYPKEIILTGGLLGRRVSPLMAQFNALWWQEVRRWHGRDQPSLSFCAWRLGVQVSVLPGTIKDNVYAAWREAEPEAEALPC